MIIILCYLSMLVLGFSDNLRGPLFFEILKSYGVSDSLGALIFSASSICGFFTSLFSIRILKKLTLNHLLSLSLFLFAVSLFGISQSHEFWLALCFFGLMGASMGFMGVAQNSLVSMTDAKIRIRAMSGLHAMYGLASLLAPLAVGMGLQKGWHWSTFFQIAACLPFVLFVSSFLWVKKRKLKDTVVSEKPSHQLKFNSSVFWACGLLASYVIAEILVASRLSLYSIREFNLSSSEASRFVTGFFLGLLSGRLLGAFIKWPGTFQTQLFVSLLASFIFTGLGLYMSPWYFILTGFAMSVFYPVCSSFLAEKFRGHEGVIFSYANAAQAISIVVMQSVVGWISDYQGIRYAMHLTFLFLFISLICLWRLSFDRHKKA
jgi:FHS family glucose/mannose:H+ symporter-like MFS transporter